MEPLFFYITASVTTLMVLLMIVQKNPISSAICLVVSFFALAAIYVTLDAHFVATLQILIYAGAIMVLFTFVIMLLNLKEEELGVTRFSKSTVAAIISGLCLCSFMAWQYLKIPAVSFPEVSKEFGTAESIGKLLFTKYVIPFELIGLLLLVGIVGSILLGRKEN